MKMQKLVAYLDDCLRTKQIKDSSVNGLQVAGAAEVTRVAFAVDARLAAFTQAAEWGAQMLVVHHGLFWSEVQPLTGIHYRRIRTLIEGNRRLRIAPSARRPAGDRQQRRTRPRARTATARSGGRSSWSTHWSRRHAAPAHGARRAGRAPCRSHRLPDGAGCGQRQAGAAGSLRLRRRGRHGASVRRRRLRHLRHRRSLHSGLIVIEELGINVIFGGHYATETLGLKALAGRLQKRFGLATRFIALPTGA